MADDFTLLDDEAVAKIGAPPVLRDSAPRAHHNSMDASSPPASNNSNSKKKSSPQLSKDALTQLKQLDASPARADATTRRMLGASSASRTNAHDTSTTAGGADSKRFFADDDDNAHGQDYIDTQRELQEEEDDIQSMVEAQRKAAQEGRFLEAHRLQRQVKDAAKDHQLHVEKDMHYGKMQALLSSREVTHSHKDKLMIFTSEWEKQLGELERRAAEERNDLASRHQRELAEQEEIIRSQISARTVNQKSKALTEAQQTTQRLASQQFYFEAHQAQRFMEQLEQREQQDKEKKMQRELARRMSALRSAKAKEMSALEARIESAREAMLTQRARDYEVLILKQFNKQVTEEQKVRVEFGMRRSTMNRKLVGMQTRMARRTQLAQGKSDAGGSKPGTADSNQHQQQQHLYRYGVSNNHSTPRGQQRGGGGGGGGGGGSVQRTPSNSSAKKPSASAAGRHVLVPLGIDYGKGGPDDLPLPVAVHPSHSNVVVVKSSIPGAAAVYGGASSMSPNNSNRKKLSPSPPSNAPPPAPPKRPSSGGVVSNADNK